MTTGDFTRFTLKASHPLRGRLEMNIKRGPWDTLSLPFTLKTDKQTYSSNSQPHPRLASSTPTSHRTPTFDNNGICEHSRACTMYWTELVAFLGVLREPSERQAPAKNRICLDWLPYTYKVKSPLPRLLSHAANHLAPALQFSLPTETLLFTIPHIW